MSAIPARLQCFWGAFTDARPDIERAEVRFYESFRVGSDAASADDGARLILAGEKTATSALLWEYEAAHRAPPAAGALSVVENGRGEAVCVVETTAIEIVPFGEIRAAFARDYAECDGTVAGWLAVFRDYYREVAEGLGREPSAGMPLVCERFRVVYPVP